jgi:hypothetical protein
MGWVVNAMPRPLYPLERLATHFIEGWVDPRSIYLDLYHLLRIKIKFKKMTYNYK